MGKTAVQETALSYETAKNKVNSDTFDILRALNVLKALVRDAFM